MIKDHSDSERKPAATTTGVTLSDKHDMYVDRNATVFHFLPWPSVVFYLVECTLKDTK